ncbi:MAG: hypothetical protein A2204_03920 [Elusimicrobia bacterium RIFOXYA1_FULL_47_7]|nr:MAG: hypothetical protein A2278_02875 [Elusimicrobia bacterium RIFOXYA12_FULL_49_49]OGS07179.1 MAG: hypothetical protein A2204_03920 [Elusimicrobia bacterium RIFOXYA1_FULL_47_7]OGS11749.1 MAG: hypothetical protein A2386_02530 [Elusimicrobia bacterium RIFOXYB1_FULL_48_9]OGS16425.1 MAG: hypothetical protein A2251_06330 [Elusimicrobia bacterium RIFOXYA2_FULL_47_53]OGS27200.1 MAG: hypothetical protein A2339_07855 [Elusimicrobia bacterium RIFOXYB12_FULL_50_12]OGS30399.1 MAG: hypothetical protein
MLMEFSIKTKSRTDFIDITGAVSELLKDERVKDGLCHIFVPHTTAGITINENADPDVMADITAYLDTAVPWKNNYGHSEGNSAAHIKASLLGSSVSVPVSNGSLVLGTWQGIYFSEFDGPRTRKVIVTVIT